MCRYLRVRADGGAVPGAPCRRSEAEALLAHHPISVSVAASVSAVAIGARGAAAAVGKVGGRTQGTPDGRVRLPREAVGKGRRACSS